MDVCVRVYIHTRKTSMRVLIVISLSLFSAYYRGWGYISIKAKLAEEEKKQSTLHIWTN